MENEIDKKSQKVIDSILAEKRLKMQYLIKFNRAAGKPKRNIKWFIYS